MRNPFDEFKRVDDVGAVPDVNPFDEFKRVEDDGGNNPMRFANKAIAGTLGAPVDLITSGLNLIPGVDIDEPFLGRKSIGKGFGKIGAPPAGDKENPETAADFAAQGVGEVAGLLVPGGVGMKMLAKGKGLISQISSTIIKSMARNPATAIVSEATGGVGAGLGRAVGEESFQESPALRTTAEIAGGVIGGTSPSLLINTPTMIAIRGGKHILQKLSVPFSKKGSVFRAGKFAKELVPDAEATVGTISKEAVGDLPPAVVSGEKKLVELYKSLIEQDPMAQKKSIEKISKSILAIENNLRKLGYGSPELLGEITRKRVGSLQLKMDNRILDATSKAKAKMDAIPVAKRKGLESVIVRNELDNARRAERKAVADIWSKVDKNHPIGVENTRKTYAELLSNLSKAEKVDIPIPLKGNPIINKKKLDGTVLREMQGLRSKLLETARIARKDGQWNKSRIAETMADAVLDDIGVSAGVASSPQAADLQAAIAATKHFKQRFESGVVGKILGSDKSGAPSIDPSLTLDISIGRQAQRGAVDIDKVLVSPESRKAAERYIARSFADYSVNQTTGKINLSQAERWIGNNEAILDQFPALQKQLADASSAQGIAEKTTLEMTKRKTNLMDKNIGLTAKFLNALDLGKEIKAATSSIRLTKDMVLKASKDKTGRAIGGLRAGFIENLLDRAHIGGFNEVGERVLSGRTLLGLVKRENRVLKEVFTPEQIARIRKAGTELSKIEMLEKSRGNVEIKMKDAASSALNLVSRVGGAQIGRFVAGLTGGGTVQTPGIFSERFRAFASHLNVDRAKQLIIDAMLSDDPKLLKALLLPLDKPDVRKANLVQLNNAMNLWFAGAGKRVIDDIETEITEDREL
jgi:hypothetical protein